MLGLFRTFGRSYNDSPIRPQPTRNPLSEIIMSSYSDSDSDSCASTESSSSRRGFVALIVSGPNAVAQFEASFPTQYKRCHLARLIALGRPTGTLYSIKLEEHSDWRVGYDFDSFILRVIPESMRAHLAVYDVSDWGLYDYWQATTSTTTGADIAVSQASSIESSESVEFDTQDHDSPLPKRSRPLETLTQRTFSIGGSRSAHTLKATVRPPKRPWPRLSSQQTSPMLQPTETADANKMPRDLTLLATDAPSILDA